MTGKGIALKKVTVTVNMGGRRSVQKEALVCKETGKIVKFLEKAAV